MAAAAPKHRLSPMMLTPTVNPAHLLPTAHPTASYRPRPISTGLPTRTRPAA